MTPQEQIAYLRDKGWPRSVVPAVCDLAERALLTDDEAEVVRRWLAGDLEVIAEVDAVLRRLLPDERVEHRLDDLERTYLDAVYETCAAREEHMASVLADDYHERWKAWTDAQHRESLALRSLWAAYVGIGETK